MKFRRIIVMAALMAATGELHAQYEGDALRFSQTGYGSTARFKATGGAQIGVGGDISSLGANPAGIGLFTKSEFSFTPEFNSYGTNANYLNSSGTGNRSQININNAGVVWHSAARKSKGSDLTTGWLGLNFGIGYNRSADFGNEINYTGKNPTSSIADYFVDLASTYSSNPDDLEFGTLQEMAYYNKLVRYDSQGYFTGTQFNNTQTKFDTRKGGRSEVNLALAGNYSNQFYIGASVGLANINYTSDAEYREVGFNNADDVQNDYNLSFRQNQITKGNGINAKIGVIYRPNEQFRIGANFETPTYYTIDDSYTEVLDTKYGNGTADLSFLNDPQTYNFTYNLSTPSKISGGISYFINNQGFISADIDFIDYSNIKFSSATNSDATIISDNNNAILSNYKSAVNYRVGGEYKLEQLILRAGYGVQGNPYKNLDNTKFAISTYSAGLGYRVNNYYVDLTYQNVGYDSDMRPYTLSSGAGPSAQIQNSKNNVFLTVGARF